MEHIGLSDDDISLFGGEFILAADKLRRAFSDKIYLKLPVPVHGNTVEMIGDNAFIIAEGLYSRAVDAVFL